MPILENHLSGNFNLDSSGIAGFFGGEEAFAAMSSVHLIRARRWLGWYNSPGSYFVAKKYGVLPNSLFWDSVFPGPPVDPTELLELDYKPGLRFSGAYNGTQFSSTGHLSYLLSRYCAALPGNPSLWAHKYRSTRVRNITVALVKFDDTDFTKWERYPKVPERFFTPLSRGGALFVLLTILFSLAASVLSALYADWFSFAMILFGALCNGVTSCMLGTGHLTLELSEPSPGATPGDGLLFDRQNVIILQGAEHIVDSLLQARFRLQYPADPAHRRIGLCALSLLAQFLLQLFLIPQGTLTGQVLFIASLAMSWMCNSYLASFDRERMQMDLMFKLLGAPRVHKFDVDKWSVAAAFAMLYFRPGLKAPEGMLDELMPNNTPAWKVWKRCICAAVLHGRRPSEFILHDASAEGSMEGQAPMKGGVEEKYTPARLTKEYEDLSSAEDRRFIREFLGKADEAFDSVPGFESKVQFVQAGSKDAIVPLVLGEKTGQKRSGSLSSVGKSAILPQ